MHATWAGGRRDQPALSATSDPIHRSINAGTYRSMRSRAHLTLLLTDPHLSHVAQWRSNTLLGSVGFPMIKYLSVYRCSKRTVFGTM